VGYAGSIWRRLSHRAEREDSLAPALEHSHLPPGATWGNLVAEWAAREHIMNVTIDYGGDLWRLRVHPD